MAFVEAKGPIDLRIYGFVSSKSNLGRCPVISTSHAKLNWARAFVVRKDKVARCQRPNNVADMNFNALFKLHKNAHWPMDHERMAAGSFVGRPGPHGRREGA